MIGENLTLVEVLRRLDPDGGLAAIGEVLTPRNPILEDMPWIEGNLPTGHKSVIRTGIPEPTWAKFNYGVAPTKSTAAPVVDTCGMLENYSQVDKRIADLNGNTAAFRVSEDLPILQGFNKALSRGIFYGDPSVDPEKICGLAPRFALSTAPSGANIFKGDNGSGSVNTSIWLVGWGEQTVFGIYPKGSKAGLSSKDLGEVTLQDAAGGLYQGYRRHYKWDAGLVVKDWKYVVRAQVKAADLKKDASAGADLVDTMVQMLEQIEEINTVRPVFYCSRSVRSMLRRQVLSRDNVSLSFDNVAGKKTLMLDEAPIKRCDELTLTEAQVV